jgi:hypothetical protein
MRHRLAVAALVIGAAYALPAWSERATGGDYATAEARRAVESFCEGDFHAQPTRDSLATYSSIRKAPAREAGYGPAVEWTRDPLTVVVAYRVSRVVAHDSTGSATVEFDELARCVGRRRFVGLPRRASAVTLNLRRTGEVWRVSDPPEPRVSKNALVAIYAAELAAPDGDWFKRASTRQVDEYQSLVAALRFLKNLK